MIKNRQAGRRRRQGAALITPARIFCFFLPLLFLVVSFPLSAQIVFSEPDLSEDNRLLFRAGSGRGAYSQDALFLSPLPGSVPGGASAGFPVQQLSAFPEKIDLLENGRTLQIRNAFGAVRVPVSGGLPMPVPGLPSFAGGNPASCGKSEEMSPSGDGRWLLYLDPVSPAFGNLIMVDVFSGAKIQIASRLERPEKKFPASWSPDSRFFIYEREGSLYYYTAGSEAMPADERIRLIGKGAINSISWGRGGDFYYLRDSTLYHVRGAELFARALYADFLAAGAAAGQIPFEFDPGFDDFWIAPDARSLLVLKGRRGLFYYPLGNDSAAAETLMPYLLLPRSRADVNVLWSEAGTVTVLVPVSGGAGTEVKAWRLRPAGGKGAFEPLPPPGAGAASFSSGSLSPDGKLVLLRGGGGILLYDYENWKLLEVLSAAPGTACLWAGDDECVTGNSGKIERITLTRSAGSPGTTAELVRASVARRDLVCLSGAERFAFEEKSFRILAESGNAWFVTDGRSPWTPLNAPRPRNASLVSGRYRVYLEKQGAGFYANLPMLRNTASVGTFPLFPQAAEGARTEARKAALCFDLYDDDRGLPETLDALRRFGIKATFFLNGEFIRRHPLSAAEIAAEGHEAASMFFAPVDLADARFRTDAVFISRGLARNEDEFFRVSGRELSLLWHPPWYALSPDIVSAAAKAGYVTAGRDIDPRDWVSRDDEKTLGLPRRSPAEMIDRVVEEIKPGSIVPVRLGLLQGGRDAYLFNRVNVLIDALLREGYTLTTVSEIISR